MEHHGEIGMSKLAELLKQHPTPANPANPANKHPKISNFSNISRGAPSDTHSPSALKGSQPPAANPIAEPRRPAIAGAKRRQHRDELLMMLADSPDVKYAYVTDTSADPVVVAIGIRGLATLEMTIPSGRYDPWKLAAIMDGEERAVQ